MRIGRRSSSGDPAARCSGSLDGRRWLEVMRYSESRLSALRSWSSREPAVPGGPRGKRGTPRPARTVARRLSDRRRVLRQAVKAGRAPRWWLLDRRTLCWAATARRRSGRQMLQPWRSRSDTHEPEQPHFGPWLNSKLPNSLRCARIPLSRSCVRLLLLLPEPLVSDSERAYTSTVR